MKHLETFERQWGILIKRDQEERSEGRQQSNPHGVYVLSVYESAEHNNFRNVLEGKKPLDLRGTLEIKIYGLIIISSLGARKNLRSLSLLTDGR